MPTHLRRYDEPGHVHFWTISCLRRLTFFHDEGMRRVVIEALRMLQQRFGICLIGYVVMPEHVHVLLFPHVRGVDTPLPISRLLHRFKQHVGFHGKKRLRQLWREHGTLWSEPLNEWATGPRDEQTVWTTRGYDFNITNHKALLTKLDYCHKNPITRGLVERPEDWIWSSYRFYDCAGSSVLPMDWDGAWPIVW